MLVQQSFSDIAEYDFPIDDPKSDLLVQRKSLEGCQGLAALSFVEDSTELRIIDGTYHDRTSDVLSVLLGLNAERLAILLNLDGEEHDPDDHSDVR